ncbi:hypothetical protein JZ751_023068 [Albula glossodonta]|uniref:Uncharacterized protein n=1 Tax=Albula glossodonta TaxID=121402 RepID=A0A8T2PNB7_9TELE|nr:hypothetical protein JZ751_023068 [Albula glossodonta]
MRGVDHDNLGEKLSSMDFWTVVFECRLVVRYSCQLRMRGAPPPYSALSRHSLNHSVVLRPW